MWFPELNPSPWVSLSRAAQIWLASAEPGELFFLASYMWKAQLLFPILQIQPAVFLGPQQRIGKLFPLMGWASAKFPKVLALFVRSVIVTPHPRHLDTLCEDPVWGIIWNWIIPIEKKIRHFETILIDLGNLSKTKLFPVAVSTLIAGETITKIEQAKINLYPLNFNKS